MYTTAVKKRVQVDSAPQSTQIPSVGIIPGGIPNSAMLSMLDNSALAGGSVSDLGQQMRERLHHKSGMKIGINVPQPAEYIFQSEKLDMGLTPHINGQNLPVADLFKPCGQSLCAGGS